MNFFQSAGSFLGRQVTNLKSFLSPPSASIPRASQANLTAQASTTRLSDQKSAQNVSLWGRVSGSLKRGFEKAKNSTSNFFTKFKTTNAKNKIKSQLLTTTTSLANKGIQTLGSFLGNKIAHAGQSGTPVDNRPRVADTSPNTVASEGGFNFFGGLTDPFMGSTFGFGYDDPIPAVANDGGLPNTASQGVITQDGGGSNVPILIGIGVVAFFLMRGGK